MLNIGSLKLNKRVMLAPMAGITDLSFRLLCRGFGCEMAFLEMINSRSLSYSNRKTQEMMRSAPQDRPLGAQLLGRQDEFILASLEKFAAYKFDILDFNAACPQKKITSRGEGASLLKEPKVLNKLLRIIVKNSNAPVTVKMRLGWDKACSAVGLALSAQDAGVQAIFMHGRTGLQGYRGPVNYDAIREVKKTVSVPVIGSGDILNAGLAKKMLDETGCDGIIVARGALGAPWIFRDIEKRLEKGSLLSDRQGAMGEVRGTEEVIDTIKLHIDLSVDFYGEKRGIINFRKFFIWYTRGFQKVKDLREKVARVDTKDKMLRLVEEFRPRI